MTNYNIQRRFLVRHAWYIRETKPMFVKFFIKIAVQFYHVLYKAYAQNIVQFVYNCNNIEIKPNHINENAIICKLQI